MANKLRFCGMLALCAFLCLVSRPGSGMDIQQFYSFSTLQSFPEYVAYAPGEKGKPCLRLDLKIDLDGGDALAPDLGAMGVVADGVFYPRMDDAFLDASGVPRLPSYRVSYGSKAGSACFDTTGASKEQTPAPVIVVPDAKLILNGTPLRFRQAHALPGGVLMLPLDDFAALLNASYKLDGKALTITLPDRSTIANTIGDAVFTWSGDAGVRARANAASYLRDGKPYVQARAILQLLGGAVFVGPGQAAMSASYDDLLMRKQKRLHEELARVSESAAPTFDAPLVTVDPYDLSPLSALVVFATDAPTKVTVRVEGKDAYTTLEHEFPDYATSHAIPVYGLYPDADNAVTITAAPISGASLVKQLSIKTGALPQDINKVKVVKSVPGKMAPGLNFFDSPHKNGNYHMAIDANGDIRWYISDTSLNGGFMLTHLRNGNKIFSAGNVVPHSYNNIAAAYEVTPLGRIVKRYEVYGLHHDVREKADGNLIFAVSDPARVSQNDLIVEIDRNSGKQIRSWDLMDIVQVENYDTKPPYTGGLNNWLHNNAVCYVEKENAFIISGRHQNLLMKFDAGSGEVLWWFSDRMNHFKPGFDKTRLTPVEPGFEYPMSQHAVTQLPDGRIMLFDNRNDNIQLPDGSLDQSKLYSRAVIYEVDPAARTVREVWQYGKERGIELYSSYISDVDYLGENHYLLTFGGIYKSTDGIGYDHIMTPGKIRLAAERITIVVEVANDEVVGEFVLHGTKNSNSFKSERFPIYQNAVEAQ